MDELDRIIIDEITEDMRKEGFSESEIEERIAELTKPREKLNTQDSSIGAPKRKSI